LREQLRHAREALRLQMVATAAAQREATELQRRLDALLGSTSWRLTGPLRRGIDLCREWGLFRRGREGAGTEVRLNASEAYARWIDQFDYQPEAHRALYERQIAILADQPLISVIMPAYNSDAAHLDVAIRSVRNQIYPHWELCICDDASPQRTVREVVQRHLTEEPRIKFMRRDVNGHISEATNAAFSLASGTFVALLDHDDVLREHALAEVAIAVSDRPNIEILYSDEDKIDDEGQRFDPFFKPDFSPDLFLAQNYLNHLTVHRAANIRRVGGWRKGFEGSQDYDLSLRILESIDRTSIVHIPKVLYHWRATTGSTASSGSEKNYAYDAGLRALQEHVERVGLGARVEPAEGVTFYRVVRTLPTPEPLVSLIIPTKDKADILRLCLDSILTKTAYPNFEILVIDNNSTEDETFALLETMKQDPRVRVLPYRHPFNYSAINNFAAQEARGSILGLVNNDIEVITPSWLTELVSHAVRPEVGCVGAKLYYPDDTIQHAGIILGIGGVAGHSHKHFPRDSFGYFSRLKVCQNVSAVTGACLVVRRDVFDDVGGLDADNLAVAFNDVDFCLRIRDRGYLNVFSPVAELYHHESISRGADEAPDKRERFNREVLYMLRRWGRVLEEDPFYSPELTRRSEDFRIRDA
jgi:GT2 family glycosyltransferase